MLNRLRTNWRAWPFFGIITGLAAMAGMLGMLTWEYKHVNVTKNIDGTKVIIQHGVDAWGPDAFIIVGISAVLAVLLYFLWRFADNVPPTWQIFTAVLGAVLVGIVLGVWALDRIREAKFNAIEAWLGAGCVAILVVAILANHLFYHDRN